MSTRDAFQIIFYFSLVTLLAVPLGHYIARVYTQRATGAARVFGGIERAVFRLCRIDPELDMRWQRYALAVLWFNCLGGLVVFGLQRMQASLPLNPTHLPAVEPHIAFNTAVSFVTNTNWQSYSGESTMSHFTQMAALTTQNFVSAATGIAVLIAFIRGFTRHSATAIGNFWSDVVKAVIYVLLPLAMITALLLAALGVIQTLSGAVSITTVEGHSTQLLSLGPVASQVAIKQLGTNGGGFFNVNSAHPFENPTALTNLIEMLAILLIPAALCFTFGALVRDKRQGWTLFAAMAAIAIPLTFATAYFEYQGTPAVAPLINDANQPAALQPNLEGKEMRFGVTGSAIFATTTTAASNGSVNSMHDSYTPLGGLVPLWLIQLGEIVFGGVGSGLYGMLIYAMLAVFIAGLMVGRTPEYLGKKIEAREMKMAMLVILVPAVATLLGTAIAWSTAAGRAALGNPGAHGFTEMLYAFSSAANNNGSAFGGLNASSPWLATLLAVCMLLGRYWVMLPVLAIAGSLANKKHVPISAGTLPTHQPLFVGLLIGTIVLIGALTYIPALALGPIAEHFAAPNP